MATKPIERLLFAQGGNCFFCGDVLQRSEASVEHLVATANGGGNHDENCVVCCKSLNRLLGRMSLKEKLGVILNQKSEFRCPRRGLQTTAPPCAEIPRESFESNVQTAITNLEKHGNKRPASVKALSNSLTNLFKQLSAQEIQALIEELQRLNILSIKETKVSYPASTSA